VKRTLTILLRLLSLATKLGLTLYMGRYFTLEDMGLYGLVFGAVTILGGAFGLEIDYVVGRELVTASPLRRAVKIRDQSLFLFLNWLGFGLVTLIVCLFYNFELPLAILLFIFAIAALESAASMFHADMTAMGNPYLANLHFFIRAGSWVFPVVALGFLDPVFRNTHLVLVLWTGGLLAALCCGAFWWRKLPWRRLKRIKIQWRWLFRGLRQSFGIWCGTMGLALGVYADRFVIAKFLSVDEVAIVTFYASFALAMLTLVQNGMLSFSYPEMIRLFAHHAHKDFWQRVKITFVQVFLFAAAIALCLAVCVPVLGWFMGKDAFNSQLPTLFLMLFAMWLRSVAETFYFVLYAQNQDRPLWLGNLLFLIPALGCNLIFVPLFGFIGIGFSALAGSVFLLIWRLVFTWRTFKKPPRVTQDTKKEVKLSKRLSFSE